MCIRTISKDSDDSGWPILSRPMRKGGLSRKARPHSLAPPQQPVILSLTLSEVEGDAKDPHNPSRTSTAKELSNKMPPAASLWISEAFPQKPVLPPLHFPHNSLITNNLQFGRQPALSMCGSECVLLRRFSDLRTSTASIHGRFRIHRWCGRRSRLVPSPWGPLGGRDRPLQ